MNEEMIDLGNRVTRSTVAVIDTMTARGAFRGEELSTIGQLRDQCIQLIQLIEESQSADSAPKAEGESQPVVE